MTPTYTIEADAIGKTYKKTTALENFHLTVPAGEVRGLLGPNGAGKTTAVKILTTLLRPSTGTARVGGYDITTHSREVRTCIGLTGQHTAVDEILTAKQNLVLFGQLLHLSRRDATRRAEELLDQFSLSHAAKKAPKTFSGGMKRRLDLASSMILSPQVLFLDEPTTGLDPTGRREVWTSITRLAQSGTTVLLTTHYLDEADQLCDRITLINDGKNLREDTPTGLKAAIGGETLTVVAHHSDHLEELARIVDKNTGNCSHTKADTLTITAPTDADPVAALAKTAADIHHSGLTVADITLRRPTLDEAFISLTSKN